MAGKVPVLETARLRLRRHEVPDFAPCAAMWADAGVTRYIGGRPFTAEEVWARLLRYVGHWELLGYGYWAVEEKSTGQFAGDIGFADFQRDLQPSIEGFPEIGWVLATAAQGKGFATEAVRAVVEWGDRRFAKTRTVCLIHPDNAASLRVAEKCGYREWERTTYKDHPTILLTR